MVTDPYSIVGQTTESVQAAQDKLVNAALSAGLVMLYQTAEDRHKKVATSFTVNDQQFRLTTHHSICHSAPEALAALIKKFPDDEFSRIRAFNQLAKANGLDLSFKSSGIKPVKTIKENKERRGEHYSPNDLVRMTAVSSNLNILNNFAVGCATPLAALGRTPNGVAKKSRFTFSLGDLKMNNTGLLTWDVNTSIDGIPAKIELAPRQQARLAAHVTQRFYDIGREYDLLPSHPELKENVIEAYNEMAGFLSGLMEKYSFSKQDLQKANALFGTPTSSQFTFDEASETAQTKKPPLKKVFKDIADLEIYADFIRQYGSELKTRREYNGARTLQPLFPMPLLKETDSDNQVKYAIQSLKPCSQMTHTCFIQSAENEVKEIFLREAPAAKLPPVLINALKPKKEIHESENDQGQANDPNRKQRLQDKNILSLYLEMKNKDIRSL